MPLSRGFALLAACLYQCSPASSAESAQPPAVEVIKLAPTVASSDGKHRRIKIRGYWKERGVFDHTFLVLYQAPDRFAFCLADAADGTPIALVVNNRLFMYSALDGALLFVSSARFDYAFTMAEGKYSHGFWIERSNPSKPSTVLVDARSLLNGDSTRQLVTRGEGGTLRLTCETRRGSMLLAVVDRSRLCPFVQLGVLADGAREPRLLIQELLIDGDVSDSWPSLPSTESLATKIQLRDLSREGLFEKVSFMWLANRALWSRLGLRQMEAREYYEDSFRTRVDWRKVEARDRKISPVVRELLGSFGEFQRGCNGSSPAALPRAPAEPSAAAGAKVRDSLESQGYCRCELEGFRNRLYIPATIENAPAALWIDSGAPRTSLDAEAAGHLGLPWERAPDAGPRFCLLPAIRFRGLETGAVVVHDRRLEGADRFAGAPPAQKIHGLLGFDLLSRYSAVLDYTANALYLRAQTDPPLGDAEGPNRGDGSPVHRAQRAPLAPGDSMRLLLVGRGYTRCELVQWGGYPLVTPAINKRPARLILDSGCGVTRLDRGGARRLGLRADPERGPGYVDVPCLELEALRSPRVRAMYDDLEPINAFLGSIGLPPVDGLVGGDILRQCQAIIDFGSNALYLKRRPED
jgi:hypothetical protein